MDPTNLFRRQGTRRALSLGDAVLILAGVAIALAGIFFTAKDLLLARIG
ncbi:hypothetical protein [Methylobacterium sp. Gmos1]